MSNHIPPHQSAFSPYTPHPAHPGSSNQVVPRPIRPEAQRPELPIATPSSQPQPSAPDPIYSNDRYKDKLEQAVMKDPLSDRDIYGVIPAQQGRVYEHHLRLDKKTGNAVFTFKRSEN